MTINQLEDERTIREVELKETEKKLTAAKKAEAVEKWKTMRDDCRKTKGELKELERQFRRAEADVDKVQHDIDLAEARLFVHRQNGPQPYDFPSDEEMKEFQQEEAVMIVGLKPLREKRVNLTVIREQLRLKLLALNADFVRMAYAERNMRALAAGEPLGKV
jgi:septal ring factor EnvC (AmiA/AmiB activator)